VPTPEEIVRSFCQEVSKRNAELLRPLLTDDVVYHNIGMPPAEGVESTLASLEGQWSMFTDIYEFRIEHIASSDDVVLTERVDVVGGSGRSLEVPLMGVFEIRDGRIAHWRDYFDSGLLAKMSTGEDFSSLVPQHH
jgi:limonene-1,2-epoxide hydrolase